MIQDKAEHKLGTVDILHLQPICSPSYHHRVEGIPQEGHKGAVGQEVVPQFVSSNWH